MKILYDHQIFYRQYYGGISRYFCELMNQFSLDSDIRFTLPLRYIQNEHLLQSPQLNKYWSNRANYFFESHFFTSLQKKIQFDGKNFALNYIFNNQGESVRLLKKQEFDIFHPTYYEPYFLRYLRKKPYVLTVYDMTHEIFPEYFSIHDQTKEWKKQLIEKAGIIIAISENTKTDLINFYDTDPIKIEVIPLASSFNKLIPEDTLDLPQKYILFVGNRRAYKNFTVLLTSLSSLLSEVNDLFLICAGGGVLSDAEMQLLHNLNIKRKVLHYPISDDNTQSQLYRNAILFVFPSLYEGFGIPILEAFSCGCPVATSNCSSLPEVGGAAVKYFDPTNSDSIQKVVEDIVQNISLQDSLRMQGYQQLKNFSWEKTASATKTVYDNLLNQ